MTAADQSTVICMIKLEPPTAAYVDTTAHISPLEPRYSAEEFMFSSAKVLFLMLSFPGMPPKNRQNSAIINRENNKKVS